MLFFIELKGRTKRPEHNAGAAQGECGRAFPRGSSATFGRRGRRSQCQQGVSSFRAHFSSRRFHQGFGPLIPWSMKMCICDRSSRCAWSSTCLSLRVSVRGLPNRRTSRDRQRSSLPLDFLHLILVLMAIECFPHHPVLPATRMGHIHPDHPIF